MIGAGALHECLADPRVTSVTAVVRASLGQSHPKLREVRHADFFDYATLTTTFQQSDACFFCLGVSAVDLDEGAYTRLTFDLTLAAARAMAVANRASTFCYVSGQGTDSSEQGRAMWARVKGRTENDLLKLPFKAAFMFRPGLIQPLHGVRSKTAWVDTIYTLISPLMSLTAHLAPNSVTTTEQVGRAMIGVAERGYPKPIMEVEDINRV